MLGRTFTTDIREGATTNELIEKVARENGGEVSKRYYPEFKTWEIVSVRIGDMALVKSSESGIHFSLGEAGIPMAMTQEQGIVFPNAEELRIGRNTRNIALWTTSANFDPGNIADIDRMYSSRGGAVLSKDARDEVSKAHGGVRSGNGILLEENILVLNKDTGEILTVAQHAAREPEPLPFAPMPVLVSSPAYVDIQPASREPVRYDPALFDAFRSRMNDASSLIIKTFDGSIADSVTVRFNPFSQDIRETALSALPQAMDARASSYPRLQNPASAPAQRLSFCMLAFGSIVPSAASRLSPVQPANPRSSASLKQADSGAAPLANPGASSCDAIPALRQKKPASGKQEIPATPSFESAYAAWKASRFSRARLDVPTGFQALERPRKKKRRRNGIAHAREMLREKIQSTLNLTARLLSILRLMRKTAAKAAQKPESESSCIRKKQNAQTLRHNLRDKSPKRSGTENAKGPRPEGPSIKEIRGMRRKGHPAPRSMPASGHSPFKTSKPARKKASVMSQRATRKRMAAPKASFQYARAFRTPRTAWARASLPGAGRKKKLPSHILWEMLGIHWKKRGRKFRMKKNSAP
jgi:hypothetical protein